LTDKAKELEFGGKSNNYEFIHENPPYFIEKLSKLINNIKNVIIINPKNEEENDEISQKTAVFLQKLVELINSKAALSKSDTTIEELGKTPLNSRLREA